MEIGIGINSGLVKLGNIGGDIRFDYTAIGDNVNLASRLEGINKQFGTYIIISESTYEGVKEEFLCRELDAVRVKGKVEPIRIYELICKTQDAEEILTDITRLFHEALSMYRASRFDDAIKKFQQIIDLRGEDHPSDVFINRCRIYKEKPPSEGWDGVFIMQSK